MKILILMAKISLMLEKLRTIPLNMILKMLNMKAMIHLMEEVVIRHMNITTLSSQPDVMVIQFAAWLLA